MKLNSVIDLKLSQDNWYGNNYRVATFKEWLINNGIEHTFISVVRGDVPHTILLNRMDALAFKLRFKL